MKYFNHLFKILLTLFLVLHGQKYAISSDSASVAPLGVSKNNLNVGVTISSGSYYINNLIPGRRYLVSVYGLTANRGKSGATLRPVQIKDSWGRVIGATGSAYINWHDGNAPQSANLIIRAPSNGVVYGYTDIGRAYNMTAILAD
ncbi:hypothetical protein Q9L42_020640 (plasmid) [Methylomarinum sp. Ch1-1]|uniref:Uncharacterized protein n=1 Tax=Methylomarinum roseum TaxID=3067653 RepID=A0AAU7P1E5_9GAMM|nr:hypothetical protein [Methylomarinum sp. Ch1-1]MDP4523327.1 hypothetical protein [Methylomarinum sp. Ch1-1]